MEDGVLLHQVGLQWGPETVLDDVLVWHRHLGVAVGTDLVNNSKRWFVWLDQASCACGTSLSCCLTRSRTPYFSGPLVWTHCCVSLWVYSHAAPFSITTRDSGSSSSALRKRWSVSWFFSAGDRNNKGLSTMSSNRVSSCWTACPLTQDVRTPLELLDQQVSRTLWDFHDLQVTWTESWLFSRNHL